MAAFSADDVTRISDGLFEAIYDRERMPAAMAALQDAIGAAKSALAVVDRDLLGGESLFWNCDPPYASAAITWANPYVPALSVAPTGAIVCDASLPGERFEHSQFFSDWARPQRFKSLAGMATLRNGSLSGMLCLSWTDGGLSADGRQLLAALGPTLRGVTRLQLTAGALRLSESQDTFDRLGVGAVVVDRTRRAIRLNATAETLFLAGDSGISLRQSMLVATNPAEQQQLSQLLALSLQDDGVAMNPGGEMLLRSARDDGRPALSVSVSPMRSALAYGLPTGRAALVLLQPVGPNLPLGFAPRIQNLFGLSRAEAALATALVAGETPQDVAEARGVSITTIRTQLAQLFRKTGTTRQTQLVAVLLRVVPYRG